MAKDTISGFMWDLEHIETPEQFDNILARIDAAGYSFRRRKGQFSEVAGLFLTDKQGYPYAKGIYGCSASIMDNVEPAYISYIGGRCLLRKASNNLFLVKKTEGADI